MAELLIIQPSGAGRSMSIVGVRDRRLLVQAASTAIREADMRARAESDPFLALVHQEEAERLRRTLQMLIPELSQEHLAA